MSLVLEIGGERCAIDGPAALLDAVSERYQGFLCDGTPSARLTVALAPVFQGRYTAPAEIALRPLGSRLELDGLGAIDVDTGEGSLQNVPDLGAFDAALRALLATRAPLRGVLWMHGVMALRADGAVVLLGRSGAGKSTAGRTLGAICDEIVTLEAVGPRAGATPYWGGSPCSAPLAALAVLERGDAQVVPLHGVEAVRALAPHVVRYVSYPASERAILQALATLARQPVWRIEAPTGEAFPPFIRALVPTLGGETVIPSTPHAEASA